TRIALVDASTGRRDDELDPLGYAEREKRPLQERMVDRAADHTDANASISKLLDRFDRAINRTRCVYSSSHEIRRVLFQHIPPEVDIELAIDALQPFYRLDLDTAIHHALAHLAISGRQRLRPDALQQTA